jgi:4-amino-4-deoxy-L-arabinose transferase-like glycosyltransferase
VWSWRRGLLLIAAVAATARLALILASLHFTLFGDPADYERHAASIASGHGFPTTVIATAGTPSAFRPPGYPFTLGGLYAVLGRHPQAGRALSALLGVAAVVLLAHLARGLWDERTGLLAGAIAAVYPPLVDLNASLLSEALFVPVELAFALALLALARRPGSVRWALAAGALAALAALTRAVADAWVLIAIAVAAGTAGARWAGDSRAGSAGTASAGSAGARWRAGTAAVLAFCAVLAPWTLRNVDQLHALVPISTEGGFTLAGQYNALAGAGNDFEAVWRLPLQIPEVAAEVNPLYRRPGGVNEAQLDAALRGAGLRYLGRHPGHLAVAAGLDTLRMLDLGTSHAFATGLVYREMAVPSWLRPLTTRTAQLLWLLAAIVVLARLSGRLRDRLGPWWLWAIPVLTVVLTVPMVGNPLKRAPLDPFAILLVAAGVASTIRQNWPE